MTNITNANINPDKIPYKMVIFIEGRRWFDKKWGNTYNTVRIYIDGEEKVTLPIEYGYGEYYMQRAEAWLKDNGYLPNMPEYQHLRHYCEDKHILLHTTVSDGLKRDLHK